MARAGACSRRDAELLIGEGRVALNGLTLTSPAVNVGAGDIITIDGVPLARRAPTRLFLFHKPRGLVTTERDPEGRPTVFDYIRESFPEAPRLVSIGRLDINTEGLLLLTNDGGLARTLELPATGWARRYRVRAKGAPDQAALDALREGVTVDGVVYAGIEAQLDRTQGANSWLTMSLREGKNREIKRVLEHLGLEVNRLIRLSFGPFQLADLPEGALDEVRPRVLRDQLGPTLAEAAGVDFASPVEERPREPRARSERDAGGTGFKNEHAKGRRPEERATRTERPRIETKAPLRRKPAPAPRKHVSAMREDSAWSRSARTRIERSATEDRSGRAVAVERVVQAPRAQAGKGRDSSAPDKGGATTRNARRFEAERKQRRGEETNERREHAASAGRKASPGRSASGARPARDFAAAPRSDYRGRAPGDGQTRRVEEARDGARPRPRRDAARSFDETPRRPKLTAGGGGADVRDAKGRATGSGAQTGARHGSRNEPHRHDASGDSRADQRRRAEAKVRAGKHPAADVLRERRAGNARSDAPADGQRGGPNAWASGKRAESRSKSWGEAPARGNKRFGDLPEAEERRPFNARTDARSSEGRRAKGGEGGRSRDEGSARGRGASSPGDKPRGAPGGPREPGKRRPRGKT